MLYTSRLSVNKKADIYTAPYIVLFLLIVAIPRSASTGATDSDKPIYVFSIDDVEFSAFGDIVTAGLSRYGGSCDYQVSIIKPGLSLIYSVTISDPRMMEVLEYWTAERFADMTSKVDFNLPIDAAAQIDLESTKSVYTKIRASRANPILPVAILRGNITGETGRWVLVSGGQSHPLVGAMTELLEPLAGREVWISANHNDGDVLELLRVAEVRHSTLELFVMSHCPFAQRAEQTILMAIDGRTSGDVPVVDIRYMLQREVVEGHEVYLSLHGEDEVQEDLVQIVIRESQPAIFAKYLLLRAVSKDPWELIAAQAGLTDRGIDAVRDDVLVNGNALLASEYAYVTEMQAIRDQSPSYVWEGQRVETLDRVPYFRNIIMGAENCSAND